MSRSQAMPAKPALLTREEAAEYLHVSAWAIHQFVHRPPSENPLPVRRAGRRDLFAVNELLAWTAREEKRSERRRKLNAQRRRTTPAPVCKTTRPRSA